MDVFVSVDHLSKQFGAFTAVEAVTFSANRGEIFGLLGPNGAGKTTTIRMIATILSVTGGKASVCGFDVRTQAKDVRRHIGVLTTDIGVYERFSGRENLEYYAALYGFAPAVAAQRIDLLAGLLEMTPFLEKRAGTYSTGMKQKLAIARSVIHDPDVIIFDEPTAGLDVLASRTVLSFMRKARELKKCVILSTHEMNDAEKLCDRVGVMYHGKLVALDTVDALKTKTRAEDLEEAFLSLVQQPKLARAL